MNNTGGGDESPNNNLPDTEQEKAKYRDYGKLGGRPKKNGMQQVIPTKQ